MNEEIQKLNSFSGFLTKLFLFKMTIAYKVTFIMKKIPKIIDKEITVVIQ